MLETLGIVANAANLVGAALFIVGVMWAPFGGLICSRLSRRNPGSGFIPIRSGAFASCMLFAAVALSLFIGFGEAVVPQDSSVWILGRLYDLVSGTRVC